MTSASGALPFSELLKRHRLAAGYTQEALAERAGLTARGIQNLEHGLHHPYPDTLHRLIRALAFSPEEEEAFEAAATTTPRRRTALSPRPTAHYGRVEHTPVPLTPLVGRQRDVEAARTLLSKARLVTLTGPPGIGKTRMALELAAEAAGDFPDGVHVVALVAVRDPNLVAPTIAQNLGVREVGGRPLVSSLHVALRDRHALLVLDNFEQVLAGAPTVADLLAACQFLRVLVTSRAPLRVSGEREFGVPPLATPDPARLPLLVDLAQAPAIRLFVERAQAIQADFALTSANAHVVASICHHLDGLPLAIELAATRIRVLHPHEILARMDHRLALLTGGARDLPARHQTLRDAIDWSYDLLGDREQALLHRLSVFAGGATFEAIEAVCLPSSDADADALDAVQALVATSLLGRTESDQEPRFFLLESIREYAAERLDASGERTATQVRHADYFMGLAEAAERTARGFWDPTRLERLEQEYDNLLAVLRFLMESGDPSQALRLGGQLALLWRIRGRFTEGRAWLAELLALPPDAGSASSRVRALYGAACLALAQSDSEATLPLLESTLALARGLNDQRGVAESLNILGLLARQRGDFAAARAMLEEGLALQRELGDQGEIGTLLDRLGEVALFQGDHVAARPLIEEGLAIRQQHGDTWGIGWSLLNVGRVAWAAGDLVTARCRFEQTLGVHRGLGYQKGIADALRSLGGLALDEGDLATARATLRESLEIVQELGMRGFIACLMADFAGLALARGLPARALRLAGAASALTKAVDEPLIPTDQTRLARRVSLARQALDETAAEAAWAAGQSMTFEQAAAYALADEPDA